MTPRSSAQSISLRRCPNPTDPSCSNANCIYNFPFTLCTDGQPMSSSRVNSLMYTQPMRAHLSVARVWRNLLSAFLIVATCVTGPAAFAQLTIEISNPGTGRIPIAIAPFAGSGLVPEALVSVVRGDLERSGVFRMVDVPPIQPPLTEAQNISYSEWKAKAADALVVGSVNQTADGRIEVRFRLHDVVKQTQLGGVAYTMTSAQLRTTAHHISDYIYEKLTGDKGIFSTRIAYVVKQGSRFELQIADADGANPQTALASKEPIISAVWSPDGKRIAYVSFENKKPVIYIH